MSIFATVKAVKADLAKTSVDEAVLEKFKAHWANKVERASRQAKEEQTDNHTALELADYQDMLLFVTEKATAAQSKREILESSPPTRAGYRDAAACDAVQCRHLRVDEGCNAEVRQNRPLGNDITVHTS